VMSSVLHALHRFAPWFLLTCLEASYINVRADSSR
jgi:hypothetical protein